MTYAGSVIRGDDVTITITVVNSAGTAINLTGITAARFILKKTISGSTILTKTLGSGVTVVTAASGIIKIDLTSSETAALDPVKHYFELEITDSAGKKFTARDSDNTLGELTILEDL